MNQSLNEFDVRLKSVLWNGHWLTEHGRKTAILKAVHSSSPKTFYFELSEPTRFSIVRNLKNFFWSLRPISLTATAIPALVVLIAGVTIEGLRPEPSAIYFKFSSRHTFTVHGESFQRCL